MEKHISFEKKLTLKEKEDLRQGFRSPSQRDLSNRVNLGRDSFQLVPLLQSSESEFLPLLSQDPETYLKRPPASQSRSKFSLLAENAKNHGKGEETHQPSLFQKMANPSVRDQR